MAGSQLVRMALLALRQSQSMVNLLRAMAVAVVQEFA
jgi:hypothetical protein